MRYQQDLQVAIRDRLRKLMVANGRDAAREIRYVADWIAGQPALRSILTAADRAERDIDFGTWEENLRQRRIEWPTNTEAGRAALIWQLLQHIAEGVRTDPGRDPLSLDPPPNSG